MTFHIHSLTDFPNLSLFTWGTDIDCPVERNHSIGIRNIFCSFLPPFHSFFPQELIRLGTAFLFFLLFHFLPVFCVYICLCVCVCVEGRYLQFLSWHLKSGAEPGIAQSICPLDMFAARTLKVRASVSVCSLDPVMSSWVCQFFNLMSKSESSISKCRGKE